MKHDEKKATEGAQFLDTSLLFSRGRRSARARLAGRLRAKGPDPNKLTRDFHELLSKHAPTWRQRAERQRIAAIEALPRARSQKSRPEMESEIQAVLLAMQGLGSNRHAGADHQKFREATDHDLESNAPGSGGAAPNPAGQKAKWLVATSASAGLRLKLAELSKS